MLIENGEQIIEFIGGPNDGEIMRHGPDFLTRKHMLMMEEVSERCAIYKVKITRDGLMDRLIFFGWETRASMTKKIEDRCRKLRRKN